MLTTRWLCIQVYPDSLAMSGKLRNIRLCDMLLRADHQWGWLCDIRDLGAGSFVEIAKHP
jgi:vacuolar protein sorting-associated protein 13A/C